MDNAKLPAYPVVRYDEAGAPFLDKRDSGLSKEEKFTMAAMQGLCHMSGTDVMIKGGLTQEQIDSISYCAVEIAEATLLELSKRTQS